MPNDTVQQLAIEAYWMPGCSACLRMKEFLEKSGRRYEAFDVAADPSRAERLRPLGVGVPAVVVGDEAVPGVDLVGIARLIGIEYDPPMMLSPEELKSKCDVIFAALLRMTAQCSPEFLEFKTNDRVRTMRELVGHAGTIMRAYVRCYDEDDYEDTWNLSPETVLSTAELVAWATETKEIFDAWWSRFGFDDPLDRVVTTYWGHPSLYEALERTVWHTAQHTRQIAYFLEENGCPPDHPLTPADLDGLPLPERIHT